MRIVIYLLFILTINSFNLYSQDSESPWALELSTGKNEYRGDRANTFFKGNEEFSNFGGVGWNKEFLEIGVTRYLNSNFDVNFQFSRGEYGVKINDLNRFSGIKTDYSLLMRYKLNNGSLLSENAFISPFVTLGLGLATYSKYDYTVPASLIIPVGVGLKVKLSSALSLQYQLLFTFNTDDKADQMTLDGYDSAFKNRWIDGSNDNFLKQTFGIVINFGNFGKGGGSRSIFNYKKNSSRRLFHK